MTGGAFATGNHEAVLGTVLMTAVDGSPAAPAGTSANPLVVTGGGSGGTTTANQGAPGASPWPVTQNDIQATNTLSLTTVGNAVTIPLSTGIATVGFNIIGVASSGANVTFYGPIDAPECIAFFQ